MRALVVEDDQDFLATIVDALSGLGHPIEVITARSRDAALREVLNGAFDLVICDLRIPTEDGALDEDIQHGLSVHDQCRTAVPGTPVILLTAFGLDAHEHLDALAPDTPERLVGKSPPIRMTSVVRKEKFEDFLSKVSMFAGQFAQLEDVEVLTDPADLPLPASARRTLRVWGSRHGGQQVQVSRLGGGLSSASVLRVKVSNQGMTAAMAVGKLGSLTTIEVEETRYTQHVASLLPAGAFASLVEKVSVGAGHEGGLFYSLADGFDRSLFDVLAADQNAGVSLVARTKEIEGRWLDSKQQRTFRIRDVRRAFVSDEDIAPHRMAMDALGCMRFEEREVPMNHCCQHRDLHGLNVLVAPDGRPLLIDYGEVDLAAASCDPVCLELSLLFHPSGRALVGAWPSAERALTWASLDHYTVDCPVPDFVRACREWARSVSAGPRELYVQAYAFSARQLMFRDTQQPIAFAVIDAAIKAFG